MFKTAWWVTNSVDIDQTSWVVCGGNDMLYLQQEEEGDI